MKKFSMNIRTTWRIIIWSFLLTVTFVIIGCTTAPPPAKPDIFWPAPPGTPRLKWVTTFYSQHNFEKTSSEIARDKFLGAEPADTFGKPIGVASDGTGQVFVADMDQSNVKIVDFTERKISMLTKQPFGELLIGLTYDSQGRLYVVDGGSKMVSVYDPGRQKLLFGFGGKEYFEKPAYIAINEKLQRVYVTDVMAGKVVVFDMSGNYQFSFAEPGGDLGQLYAPMGVAVAPNGDVFVAEFLNARIHVFDQDGKALRHFGKRGDREWQFEGPRGLAFTSDGKLVITDARKAALLIYTQDGQALLYLSGKRDPGPLGLSLPTGVWVDQNDRIYITDSLAAQLTIWQYLSPRYLEQHPLDPKEIKNAERLLKK